MTEKICCAGDYIVWTKNERESKFLKSYYKQMHCCGIVKSVLESLEILSKQNLKD